MSASAYARKRVLARAAFRWAKHGAARLLAALSVAAEGAADVITRIAARLGRIDDAGVLAILLATAWLGFSLFAVDQGVSNDAARETAVSAHVGMR